MNSGFRAGCGFGTPSGTLAEQPRRARNLLSCSRDPVRQAIFSALGAIILLILPFHGAFAGSGQVLAPVTAADGRLGLDDVLPGAPLASGNETWGQLAYNAGARIDRWEFRWDQIERGPGQYDFTATDAAVQSAQQAGLQVEGILIGTPGWAAGRGQRPGNGVPKGLFDDYTDPRNLWADYVRATVAQYKGQVRAWEVWNEPDIKFFWSGTAGQYFRLLKVAYQTVKSVDPSATVLMAGMVDPSLAFPTQVLTASAADPSSGQNNGYFDAVAWHAYGPAKPLYTNLLAFRALLASKGYANTPLWVTEDGFPASNPNGEPRQAAYVLQTIAYAFAAGATKVLVYRASDDTTAKSWGLMAADGTPRMGYIAYQVAAQYLAGTLATTYVPGTQVERFAFYRPGQRLILLWNHGIQSTNLSITADMPNATLVDWMGNSTPVEAVNGSFDITLPGAYYNVGVDTQGTVVGGPPTLLIEDNPTLSGLPNQQHVPPVPGSGRGLVLFNPSTQYSTVTITPNGSTTEHETIQIPGETVRDIDLDLLAGPSYSGFYNLGSSSAIVAEAYSGSAATPSIQAARTWYVPGGTTMTIGNTTAKPVTVSMATFGRKGVRRARQTLFLHAASRLAWSVPAWLRSAPHTVTFHATGPIVVTGDTANAVATAEGTWYAVRPGTSHLTVFNPSPTRPARLNVRFVGSPAMLGQQIRLAARNSIQFSAHGARAVIVHASHPVAAGTLGSANPAPLASQAQTTTALPSAGSTTSFSAYNPQTKPAQVTFSDVGPLHASPRTIVVGPGRVATFRARASADAPLGVLSQSNLPVVVTPAR